MLKSPAREPSGYRRYAKEHLDALRFIRHRRSLDVSLTEVRRLLEYSCHPGQSCGEVNALVDDQIRRVRERIDSLTSLERQLVSLRSACSGENGGRSCGILASFKGESGH
jgi:DNA-binding transcriptional MerR regulator